MNRIESILKEMETDTLKFRPNNEFYKKIGISKKRFWQIVRAEKSATVDEITIIASILKVEPKELI